MANFLHPLIMPPPLSISQLLVALPWIFISLFLLLCFVLSIWETRTKRKQLQSVIVIRSLPSTMANWTFFHKQNWIEEKRLEHSNFLPLFLSLNFLTLSLSLFLMSIEILVPSPNYVQSSLWILSLSSFSCFFVCFLWQCENSLQLYIHYKQNCILKLRDKLQNGKFSLVNTL